MSYAIPQDGYDSFLSAPLDSADTVAYVNELPAESSGIAVIYSEDGRTVSEKISFSGTAGTGTSTDPYRLTGLVRKLRATATAGVILFTSSGDGENHGANRRIAITDNIHYLGVALAVLNGDMPMGGVMQLPASRTIDSARDVVDKEFIETYASSLGGGVSAFMVSQNGADPSLTINVGAGRLVSGQEVITYAGAAAQAVTNNATNYVQIDWNGTLLVNTSGFLEGYVPLAEVVASSGDITSITDRRAFLTSNGALDKIITDRVTLGATLTALDPVYFDAATGKAKKASASATGTIDTFLGVVLDSGVDTDTGKRIQIGGVVTGLSGLTAGSVVYVTNASTFTHTPGTVRAPVGVALSTTSMYLFPLRRISDLMGASSAVTTDILNEMAAFFAATDQSGSEAETLTGGPTSNADALHTHSVIPAYIQFPTENSNLTIPLSTNSGYMQFQVSPDGLYGFLIWKQGATAELAIRRYTWDALSRGFFYDGTNVTLSNGTYGWSNDACALVVGATYVWAIGSTGSDTRIVRLAMDLTGATTMTISGTAFTGVQMFAFGNDTNIYIKSASAATTLLYYTVSGTTATRQTDITLTSAVVGPTTWDGSSFIYNYEPSSGTIRKYALAGGAVVSTTIRHIAGLGNDFGASTSNFEPSVRFCLGWCPFGSALLFFSMQVFDQVNNDREIIHMHRMSQPS